MLREHTSLTFTQKYYQRPPKFFTVVEILSKGSSPAQSVVMKWQGGGSGIRRR